MQLYGITAVSRETGIHESSLRRWEDMGLIIPWRIDLGRTTVRIYSDADLRLLKLVKHVMDSGMTLRASFNCARAELHGDDAGADQPATSAEP